MLTNKKAASPGRGKAASNTTYPRDSIASSIKAVIVNLALWGVIPFGLSAWLIRRLHLEAA